MAHRTKGADNIVQDLDSAIARNFERERNLHIASMSQPVKLERVFGESFKNISGAERVCTAVLASYPGVRSRIYVLTAHDSVDVSEYADLDLVEHFKQVTGVSE